MYIPTKWILLKPQEMVTMYRSTFTVVFYKNHHIYFFIKINMFCAVLNSKGMILC